MLTKIFCSRLAISAIALIALSITTTAPSNAGHGIQDRLVGKNSSTVIDKVALQTLPEIAELRALSDPSQRWRLGLLLADTATRTGNFPSYFEMMSEAQAIALELAEFGMRDWLLSEIIARQVSVGDIGNARANVLMIEHAGWKAEALILIAHAAPRGAIGSSEEARRVEE